MEEKPPGKAGRLFSVNNLPIHGAEAPEKERKPTLSGLTLKLTAWLHDEKIIILYCVHFVSIVWAVCELYCHATMDSRLGTPYRFIILVL